MVSLVAKIRIPMSSLIINSNWMQKIMDGRKKKLRYSEETPWFPKYYIGWIGIGNCDQGDSVVGVCCIEEISRENDIAKIPSYLISTHCVDPLDSFAHSKERFKAVHRAVILFNWQFQKFLRGRS